MAERRMFAKSTISGARFLRMPATARLLYYDLGMEADDDGCVEAFSVMRKTGAAEDDLRVLASKGFIKVLNDDLVSYIMDWNINNKIRKDRYHPGIYGDLIQGICNVQLPPDNQVTTNRQPPDNQVTTEVSLGKSSLVQSSSDQDKQGKGSGGNLYGVFENVYLTPEQYMSFQSWKNFFPVLDQLSMDIHNGERVEDPALRLSSMLVADHYGGRA